MGRRHIGHGQPLGLAADAIESLVTGIDQRKKTVRPLLAALPERQQTVLMLRFFENMTQTQIAERLGISQMHVSRLVSQSLEKLRKQNAGS